MEVMAAIMARRSIRRYKPDSVKEEHIQAVLEAARWAPSWRNSQCWRFIVVKDVDTKSKLADTLNIWPENPAIPAIRSAPVLIAACAQLGRSGYYKGQPATDKGDWFMFDVALAMQNLVLAACSLGLGTIHVGFLDAKQAAAILQLPEDIVFVEMIPLGYPDEEPLPPPRKELSQLLFYDRYGQGQII